MSFVYPYFLWALLTLAVPVIIHLFYFRRYKIVFFTNVRFLREVKEQTAARSRLRHLLALAMRMLALAALVFAFAMPYLPDKNENLRAGGRDVSIFFDNSFSMSAQSEEQRLIELARLRAEEILAAYDNDDRIQILTADFEGRDQRLLSKEEALARIREVKISYTSRDLAKALQRQKSALQSGKYDYKDAYIISDFQANICQDLKAESDTAYKVHLVPLQAVQNKNIGIDSAWFASPVQTLQQANTLYVRVRNYADTEFPNARLSLTLDGQTRPEGTINVPAKGYYVDTINLTLTNTGWHTVKLNVTDFPIEFDNDYFFSFYVSEQVNLLEIHDGTPSTALAAAFAKNGYFKHSAKPLGQLDYSQFAQNNMLILNELKSIPSGLTNELTNYIKNGGNVFVFPHPEATLSEYNALSQALNANEWGGFQKLERAVATVNYDDFVFNDVFDERRDNLKLPNTTGNYAMQRKASEESLLRYRDGAPFVSKHVKERGHLYLCAAPLRTEFSTLVQNGEIFVPMLYRAAISSAQSRRIAYTIGVDNSIETISRTSVSEMVYKIGGEAGEFIPEQRTIASRVNLGINNQIQQAGFYNLFYTAGEILDRFAFNYDRKESDLRFLSADELRQKTDDTMPIIEGTKAQDFTSIVAQQSKGTPLWKLFLILALVFLLLETAVLRLIKG